jgi:hypothetical protein
MSQPTCKSRHKCMDGGEGECTQSQGHFGRHVCSSCLALFGSGESIRPEHPQGAVAPATVRTQDTGDGVDHWHCAHCGTKIPLASSVCGLCGYKICNGCSEAKCPKTIGIRPQDAGDGVDHWHCAHCGVKIPLNSPVCKECGYKVCQACTGNEDCCALKSVRPQDAGDGVDHWHCAHCGVKIPLNSPVCKECGYKVCQACTGNEDCCALKFVRPQDAGDGVDHWHCAHCNTRIPLNASVCGLCGYKICNSCSEAKCPRTMGICPQDYFGPTDPNDFGWRALRARAASFEQGVICESKHSCEDGSQGSCDSVKNHTGRHTCDHCQTFFSLPGERGSAWCVLMCPDCGTQCRRTATHAGTHVCSSDHAWQYQEKQAAR